MAVKFSEQPTLTAATLAATDLIHINDVSAGVNATKTVPVQELEDYLASGDVVGPSSSVDSEVALFNSTTGKLIKRASVTGIAKLTSGVLSAATSGTDYETAGTSATHAALTAAHGATGAVVGTTNTQTLTNKNIVLTINSQSASYTALLTDAGKMVAISDASANTFTIPPNASVAFPLGTAIGVFQQGAGQTTITAGVGVTLRAPHGAGLYAQYSTAYIWKIGTNEWVLCGDAGSASASGAPTGPMPWLLM